MRRIDGLLAAFAVAGSNILPNRYRRKRTWSMGLYDSPKLLNKGRLCRPCHPPKTSLVDAVR